MQSNNGEYIIVDFTSEELQLISERAEYMAQFEETHPIWKQMFWQLALSANHLSAMLETEEKPLPKLEKYETGLESAGEDKDKNV